MISIITTNLDSDYKKEILENDFLAHFKKKLMIKI